MRIIKKEIQIQDWVYVNLTNEMYSTKLRAFNDLPQVKMRAGSLDVLRHNISEGLKFSSKYVQLLTSSWQN